MLVLTNPKVGKSIPTWIFLAGAAWFFNIYASIIFGVLAAVINSQYRDLHKTSNAKFLLVLIFSSTVVSLAYGANYEILAPILSICIVMLLAKQGKTDNLGKFLGGISYPLYLNHWIGVFAGNVILSPYGLRDSPERQAFSAIFNVLIASVLYVCIDKKLLEKRESLYSISRGMIIIATGYGMIITGLIIATLFMSFQP